ncbi:hypothetical protein B0T26DRAFT_360148 [Lasiosphaeria miniovina]|uniref:Uncharacterized protein n=1 Tax=Lasiosphaeria miniovina TaxID=1954250 RepID=A0AA40ACJ1_9PEZI|nr:uncharacterized protein B0T26DRAFT_360148 [Lasiosphaeria miniovina]KAK0713259.1 hypothetical protein B0T26DRAFT_360148 [Lasiosphaeria miniovina]
MWAKTSFVERVRALVGVRELMLSGVRIEVIFDVRLGWAKHFVPLATPTARPSNAGWAADAPGGDARQNAPRLRLATGADGRAAGGTAGQKACPRIRRAAGADGTRAASGFATAAAPEPIRVLETAGHASCRARSGSFPAGDASFPAGNTSIPAGNAPFPASDASVTAGDTFFPPPRRIPGTVDGGFLPGPRRPDANGSASGAGTEWVATTAAALPSPPPPAAIAAKAAAAAAPAADGV